MAGGDRDPVGVAQRKPLPGGCGHGLVGGANLVLVVGEVALRVEDATALYLDGVFLVQELEGDLLDGGVRLAAALDRHGRHEREQLCLDGGELRPAAILEDECLAQVTALPSTR